jgi:hypothetical protein
MNIFPATFCATLNNEYISCHIPRHSKQSIYVPPPTSPLQSISIFPTTYCATPNNQYIPHHLLRHSKQSIYFPQPTAPLQTINIFPTTYCATPNNEFISRHLRHHSKQSIYFPPPTAPLQTINIFPTTYCATPNNQYISHHLQRHSKQGTYPVSTASTPSATVERFKSFMYLCIGLKYLLRVESVWLQGIVPNLYIGLWVKGFDNWKKQERHVVIRALCISALMAHCLSLLS